MQGNDTYPAKESWLIAAIDPNIASHRSSTTGSPSLTAVDHFAIIVDQSGTSKAENYALDAIDVGAGLTLVGGDGGDADGTWQDFVDLDEGTALNRWGLIHTKEGILYTIGEMIIGTSSATVFTDSQKTIVFSDGLFAAGFSGITLDLQNVSTNINMTSITFLSQGTASGEDTRPIFNVSDNTGIFTAVNCLLDNFASITLTTACDLETCIISNSGQVDAGGGSMLEGCSIINSTVAANTSSLLWDVNLNPDGELDNMVFTKGSAAHHAIEFGTTSPLTMTVIGLISSGFNSANNQNDSFFHVKRTSGTVTINVQSGTGNFSYRTDGATVNIVVDPVDSLFTVLDENASPLQNARVLVEASDGTGDLPYQNSVTITRSGSTASVSHTAHGMAANDIIVIRGADQDEYNCSAQITNVTANAYDYTVSGTPTTPATGTIIATGAVVSGLTDVNGEIKDTRSWTNSQPIIGSIRKSTTSPFYKTSTINGTISITGGISTSNVMILDE